MATRYERTLTAAVSSLERNSRGIFKWFHFEALVRDQVFPKLVDDDSIDVKALHACRGNLSQPSRYLPR